ncbi:carbohydrate ABC transporter permease [Nonomuraea sp. NPDC059194]|uniref:carbohydrate ABC transporter permease n=1 Tax=Nonomuraea sp. NPDC059194 TaxID=3346764 RepID=UPI0036C379D7
MNGRLRAGANGALAVFLGLIALVQLLPFWLALSSSTKPQSDVSSVLIPRITDIAWSNFEEALTSGNVLSAIASTALVTGVSTVFVCLLGAMAAYPLARRLTRFNRFVSGLILSLIMIPPLSTLVPLYTLLTQLGAINTYWGQIVISVAGGLPLSVFLYAAFMRNIPVSLDEAAGIDGANAAQTFFRIIFPLLKPVTATVAILTGVGVWNDYALSNFVLTDPEKRMVAPAVGAFFAQQTSNLGAGSAAALLAVLPVLIAYLCLQRLFMSGMVAGAVK